MKDMHSQKEQIVADTQPKTDNPRRQFFKKAALGSAFVSTLASRPVWATGCTVSGQLSGNLSNPDRNDCDDQATGKSPGWWGNWITHYNYFNDNPSVVHYSQVENKDQSLFGHGLGKMAALYNFAYAAAKANLIGASLPGWVNLHPVDTYGVITAAGIAVNDNGDQEYRHLVAGLLSAAHDGIAYPYPGNEWTVAYIWGKYIGTNEERAQLDALQKQFIGNHAEPTGILSAGISNEEIFNWTRDYLRPITP